MIRILIGILRTNVCHNEPVIFKGKITDQQIKGTLGITGWYTFKVLIDGYVWHLDVDSPFPCIEDGT